MSFGFSVGDFIAVLHLVVKLRDEFKDAPAEWADLDTAYVVDFPNDA